MIRKLFKVAVKSPPAQKQALVNAYNEQCFWDFNGSTLGNLKDLLRAFKCMSEVQFSHHVTSEKNDFALWVKHILKDEECAASLAKATTIKRAVAAVERRLKDYYL